MNIEGIHFAETPEQARRRMEAMKSPAEKEFEAAQELRAKLGLEPDLWAVTPKRREEIMNFRIGE